MRGDLVAACALSTLVALASGAAAVGVRSQPARERVVRIAVTGDLRSRIRRCGCQGARGATKTTEILSFEGPRCCKQVNKQTYQTLLPDPGALPERSAWLARTAALEGPILSLDTGDLLFPGSEPQEHERAEWRLRAELMVESYGLLGVSAFVPGEGDFALGRKELERLLAPARFRVLAANLVDGKTHARVFEGRAKFEMPGGTVGVVGIFSPPEGEALAALLAREGLEATDPVEAARVEAAALRAEGVDLVVLIGHAPDERIRAVVRGAGGVDLAFGAHSEVPTKATSHLEGATAIARTLPGGGAPCHATVHLVPGAQGVVERQTTLERQWWLAQLSKQVAEQEAELAKTTDPAARKALEEQIAWTRSRMALRETEAPREPRHEVSVHLAVLDWRRFKQGQDPALIAAIDRFKEDVEKLALDPALVARMEAPAKGPAGAGFLTETTCERCHEKQARVWKSSKHAHAWASLELAANQKDPECVRCHAVGLREPGGFAEVRRVVRDGPSGKLDFRNVQCEACHGPRLGHPESSGVGSKPTTETCVRCHDPERDPTFSQKRRDEALTARSPICVKD